MGYEKARWKWHECLQARFEVLSNDSECDNDDFTLLEENDQERKSNETMCIKQEQLKQEASLALAVGAKMARMQVKLERENLEKSRLELYEFIGINVNTHRPLTIDTLEELNLGQLQILVNDLYCQIEATNEELINLLIERDSLSMEQDSILVDIEDLTRRIEERSRNARKNPKEYIYLLKHSEQSISKSSLSLIQKIFSTKLFF